MHLSLTQSLMVCRERLSLLTPASIGPWQAEPTLLVNMLILFAYYAAQFLLIGKLYTNPKE